jgi:simple sugar transport system permease protein
LKPETRRALLDDLLIVVCGLAAAELAFALVVWGYGESPHKMLSLVAQGTWGTAYGIGQVLFKATPLVFTGLAVHVGLRAGLFNVGAEGQLAVASLAVASLGAHVSGPAWLLAPTLLAVAAISGALWAAVPALLRARFGAHEVLGTLLMNRVADAAVSLALGAGLAEKGSVRTPDVAAGAHLARLDAWIAAFRGSAASTAVFLAIVVLGGTSALLPRTRAGREQWLVGQNPEACAAERIPVRWRTAQALLWSGALAGLAASGTVLGYKGYYEQGLGAGAGFGGIAVALLGRGRPVGIVLAALLVGTLQQGGLAINGHVPMELMTVAQGVAVVGVALADARLRHAVLRARGVRGVEASA